MELNGKRILIVEDEASIAELLDIALTSEGCIISIASNGYKAREIIENDGYDLYFF